MFIGISAYNHESAVALVNLKGELIDYCREEFLTRIKGDKSFPIKSLEKIFCDNNLNQNKINRFVFYERPLSAFLYPLKVASLNMPKSISLLAHQFRSFKKSSLTCFLDLSKNFPGSEKKLLYLDHHLSHTLSCLPYAEMRENICSIVVDGFGDRSSSSIQSVISPVNIKELWNLEYPVSIGLFYSAITDFLGFAINEGEYKVMGLAAFGNPKSKYKNLISKLIYWDKTNSTVKANMKYFDYHVSLNDSYSKKLVSLLGEARNPFKKLNPEDEDFQKFADIARAAQDITEDLLKEIFKHGHKLTNSRVFYFSGGVAMNSASLRKLANLSFVDKIFLPPSPGDAGASIGAAYYGYLKSNLNSNYIEKPKIFPSVAKHDSQVKSSSKIISNDFNILTKNQEEALIICARLISEGEIIGTVIGNAETGPRALGNRSLICDGKSHKAVKILNTVIKSRSPFRPTAPAMKMKTARKYYKLEEALIESYQTMSSTCECLKDSNSLRFPVTHIDGTARLQIVEEGSFLFSLLSNLSQYDIDIIANSSLNISGDPTCYDFIDGLMVCTKTPLKFLLTDYGLLQKKE